MTCEALQLEFIMAEDFNDSGVGNLLSYINTAHVAKVKRERHRHARHVHIPDLVTYQNLPQLLDLVRGIHGTKGQILRARLGLDRGSDGRARSAMGAAEIVFPGCNATSLARELERNFRDTIYYLQTLMEGKRK